MIRVGILGSDNSHALHFSKLCNIPDENGNYLYDDIRVTAIYGRDDDPEHTKQVAEEGKIEFIAKDPQEFMGKVDAVMVVYRKGRYHVPEILPFIEAGYPVWIDKPICEDIEDIKKLREACERNNTLITGGSTLKYNHEIVYLKEKLNAGVFKESPGGVFNFPGDFESEYGGVFFYGSHIVEAVCTVFGYDVKSVQVASIGPKKSSVALKYENRMVILNMMGPSKGSHFTVYGHGGTQTVVVNTDIIYKLGFAKFAEMLRTKEMPLSFDNLVKPVYILTAIKKAYEEKREVTLEEVM